MKFSREELFNLKIAVRVALQAFSEESFNAIKSGNTELYKEKHELKMKMSQLLHKLEEE